MRRVRKSTKKVILYFLPLLVLAIPLVSYGITRPVDWTNSDWIVFHDDGETPILPDACVLQYKIKAGGEGMQPIVDRQIKRIGRALGIPTQYSGTTTKIDDAPNHDAMVIDFNPVIPSTVPTGTIGWADTYHINVGNGKYVLRGGRIAITPGALQATAPENVILHEMTHAVGLGDRYSQDSMMGTRIYQVGADYSAYDYALLNRAGAVSRDPAKCWISSTMNRALRPDVTRGSGVPPTTTPTTIVTSTTTTSTTSPTNTTTTTIPSPPLVQSSDISIMRTSVQKSSGSLGTTSYVYTVKNIGKTTIQTIHVIDRDSSSLSFNFVQTVSNLRPGTSANVYASQVKNTSSFNLSCRAWFVPPGKTTGIHVGCLFR